MSSHQDQFDDAMFDYSTGEYAVAISKLQAILAEDPDHFDARLGLAMSHYRLGDYPTAIAEGHRAEKLKPNEQLVHTNLSLFYMKSGDKQTAEAWIAGSYCIVERQHGRSGNSTGPEEDADLRMAQPKAQAFKLPEKFPDMPWKKNTRPGGDQH